METMTVLAMVLGGASGAAVGRLGRAVLSRLRRGVRPPPWSCETAVAVLWALVAARTAAGALPVWWAPVPLLLAWGGVLLVACDLLASRLPDALTLPAYPALFAAIGVASCASGSPVSIGAALLGAGLFAGVYLLVRLIAPASLGPGDVKLSGALGAAVGAVALLAVPLSMLASAVLTLLHLRRSGGAAAPHGPAMLLPAWLVTAVGPVPSAPVGGG